MVHKIVRISHVRPFFLTGYGSSFVGRQDLVVDGGITSVARGSSATFAARCELLARLKAAAEAL